MREVGFINKNTFQETIKENVNYKRLVSQYRTKIKAIKNKYNKKLAKKDDEFTQLRESIQKIITNNEINEITINKLKEENKLLIKEKELRLDEKQKCDLEIKTHMESITSLQKKISELEEQISELKEGNLQKLKENKILIEKINLFKQKQMRSSTEIETKEKENLSMNSIKSVKINEGRMSKFKKIKPSTRVIKKCCISNYKNNNG